MNPFWNNIYDDVKDRRYGALFFATLLIFFAALPLTAALFYALYAVSHYDADEPLAVVLFSLAVFAAVVCLLVWKWVRGRKQRRIDQEERLKYSNLSRDELAKARSKLRAETGPVTFRRDLRPPRRPPPRAPDVDLKY